MTRRVEGKVAFITGAANAQAGVENVLDILRGGIDSALLGLGKASIHDLTPDDIVVPPGSPAPSAVTAPSSTRRSTGRPLPARTMLTGREGRVRRSVPSWMRSHGSRTQAGSARACGGCEQAKGAGALDGLAAAVRAELCVEVVHVGLDGVR